MSRLDDFARLNARQLFLSAAGWGDAERFLLPGDASFRRYIRLTGRQGSAMLMDAPPPQEDVRPFVLVAELLLALGYSAPRLLARDVENGFLLLEDFGDLTYTRALAAGYDETGLYSQAIDLLVDLHDRGGDAARLLPAYDQPRLIAETDLFIEWYLPAVRKQAVIDAERQTFQDLWRALLRPVSAPPSVVVLRDFHVDNMMVLDRQGRAKVGLLDFQDALAGSPVYDLVSLLRDARRDVSPALAAAMTERYLTARPMLDETWLRQEAALLAAQRTTKILGIFTRLAIRDRKPGYLAHIARLWRLLEEDMTHPALAALADWMAAAVPPAHRIAPTVDWGG